MGFVDLDEALEWLERHVDYERVAPSRRSVPTLQPIFDVLQALGSPQLDYPSIHVTGTNGKGTTSTLISHLLGATGLRVGIFTSPDLHAVNERIAVVDEPIADDDLTQLLSRLADVERVSATVLTRFELLTVGALLHFSDEGVDVAVIEVGVGGTWDSTNVVDGVVSVITNVDLDHVAILGSTVAEIAADKSGIIKPGSSAIVGTANADVLAAVNQRAEVVGATVHWPGVGFELERNDVAVGGRLLSFSTPFQHYEDVMLSLHGMHQGDNAVVAVTSAETFLGRELGDRVVRRTLGSAAMPGRLEVLQHHPTIIVDGAHNPAGTAALSNALKGAFYIDGSRRCVIGMLSGRNVDDTVAPLLSVGFTEFYCCAPSSPRAVAPELVAEALRRRGAIASEHPTVAEALASARQVSGEDDLIVGAGSLYLVAAIRSIVLGIADRHR